jgi:hypothetical protein
LYRYDVYRESLGCDVQDETKVKKSLLALRAAALPAIQTSILGVDENLHVSVNVFVLVRPVPPICLDLSCTRTPTECCHSVVSHGVYGTDVKHLGGRRHWHFFKRDIASAR